MSYTPISTPHEGKGRVGDGRTNETTDRAELPGVWVIFALFAGGVASGFLGVMLAGPLAATIGGLWRNSLRRSKSSTPASRRRALLPK